MIKPPAGPRALVLVAALAVVAGCNVSAPKSGPPAGAGSQSASQAASQSASQPAGDSNPSTVSARRVAAACGRDIAGAAGMR
jgi:hypothetical protein